MKEDQILIIIAKWLDRLDSTLNRIRVALEVIAAKNGKHKRKSKGRRDDA